MPATLRYLSWNIQHINQSKITNNPSFADMFSDILRRNTIDIFSILEVNWSEHELVVEALVYVLNNSGYRQGWRAVCVNVGDQGIIFGWHTPAAGQANSFCPYLGSHIALSSAVYRNQNDDDIHFTTNWTQWKV